MQKVVKFKTKNLNLKNDNCSDPFKNFDDSELEELFNENPIRKNCRKIESHQTSRIYPIETINWVKFRN